MPSLRVPYLRTALQPWARVLPRAQPITNQIRQQSQKPADKGTTGGYKLDGTNAATSNRNLMYIGGVTAVIAGIYFFGLSKPDKAAASSIKNDPDAVKHQTGSDRQRVGGPERSAK